MIKRGSANILIVTPLGTSGALDKLALQICSDWSHDIIQFKVLVMQKVFPWHEISLSVFSWYCSPRNPVQLQHLASYSI